jgi:ribose transport system substrate-binding protein
MSTRAESSRGSSRVLRVRNSCAKAHATEERIKECAGCEMLEFSNSPISEVAQRQPALVTAWVQKYGTPLYITSVADYTADFQIPTLRAGGIDPKDVIIVSADGNKSAYERIRAGGQWQLVTASGRIRCRATRRSTSLTAPFRKRTRAALCNRHIS